MTKDMEAKARERAWVILNEWAKERCPQGVCDCGFSRAPCNKCFERLVLKAHNEGMEEAAKVALDKIMTSDFWIGPGFKTPSALPLAEEVKAAIREKINVT